MSYIGIDIGGTKCAVVRGTGRNIEEKISFNTQDLKTTLAKIYEVVEKLMTADVEAVGISCGGPLDSVNGIIQSPPNLPGWDDVRIVGLLESRFGKKAYLCNDADACALAEWRYGAGCGTENMIFLTFGTGIGAGLILGGRLYSGSCQMAGEIGHVTLYDGLPSESLHIGYNKRGAVEGYCSGGGIAQYGKGSAAELGIRAERGDTDAIALYEKVGEDLGKTLSILIDILNPQAIVIGSIYARSREFIEPAMMRVIKERALEKSASACSIYPAALGESIGDVAALCVAELGAGSTLYENYPELKCVKSGIDAAVEAIVSCYRAGGKLLIAGNGGSASDSEHIVGELMKGFKSKRPVSNPDIPAHLSSKLQCAIPAISLSSGLALPTAYQNDVDGEYTVAQTLHGLAKPGDIAVLLSTSGNAKNLLHAAELARCIGVGTIALTGESGGMLAGLCDIAIKVPARETYRVQEYHLPVYHEICARVETEIFG